MPVRTITHTAPGLTVTMRERIGSDAIDKLTLFFALREHIKNQTGLDDELKPRLWMRITFVVNVIQQTVSLEGDDRFDIPSPYASDEDVADFYDFLMARPPETVEFLQAALKRVNADPAPLVTGAPNETPSEDAPAQDFSLATAS